MKKVVIASVLSIVSAGLLCTMPALALPSGVAGNSSSGAAAQQITIKSPAEYNAYQNAMSQSSPAAKAAAIEQFLKQYPKSVVKKDMLQQLVIAYNAAGKRGEAVEASRRLLKVEPNNIRALVFASFVAKTLAGTDAAKLKEAATYAEQGLKAPKPASMSEAQYSALKPLFLDVIGASQQAQKDYKGAIQTYLEELHSFGNPNAATQKGIGLYDTYNLANAYVQQDPKDQVNAIWYFTRAAQFLTGSFQQTAEKAAKYWYQNYHNSMDGYDAIVAMTKTNLFPPSNYTVKKYVPPTPEQLAHQAVATTPDLNSLSLHDKEYVLKNGSQDDANKVWAVLNGKVAEVPGIVVSATADSVQVAVSPDAQNSNQADFTVNMKKPLKKVPNPGDKVTYIAKFSSFTQNPLMIIMSEGIVKPPAAKTHRSVHHVVHHRR